MVFVGGMGGLGGGMDVGQPNLSSAKPRGVLELEMRVRDLEHHVARLSLLNQALWEVLREELRLRDEDIEQRAHEVDLRDGKADGEMNGGPVRCPSCNRVSSGKHYKCLYCGQLFEKPLFG